MKKTKIFVGILIIVATISFVACTKAVDADSGWDSSYDSGGSWDSGSDWGSSSWDYSYDSGDSGGGSLTFGEFIISFIVFAIIIVICSSVSKKSSTRTTTTIINDSNNYRELTKEEIDNIDATIDKNTMNMKLFEIYKEVQNAWMNFDYETLRKYTTDELYNMYKSQLKVLSTKKQKNIMENITFLNGKIIDITIENGVEKVKMYLNISMKDYVVDANNKVVRGSKNITSSLEYLITLNRNITKEKIKKCPSCGATIDIEAGGKCPYCDSTIVNNNNEFVMSKKECVGQKRIG